MRKLTPIVLAGVFLILSAAAFGVARYTDTTRMRLEQEGSGGGQAWRANIDWVTPPPPPEQQREIDDFAPPPLRMDANEKLIPVDPEQRRAAELAIVYAEIYDVASQAVWMIPLAGLCVVLTLHGWNVAAGQLGVEQKTAWLMERALAEKDKEEDTYEPQIDSRLGLPDGAGGPGDGPGLPSGGGTPGDCPGGSEELREASGSDAGGEVRNGFDTTAHH